ncbi:MAG TPA: 30S ribosomal protein S18 [Candidatus Brocadiia bacterium]|nr:30S ribosomal protein S18 [Candidatus Brocadiia bacterium]
MPKREKKKRIRYAEQLKCRFCRANVGEVDYKDMNTLQKLLTSQGRMFSRKRSGNCSKHQRSMKKAIKVARFLGLLPYTA